MSDKTARRPYPPRLKQAFGRLVRSQEDKGCCVVLESAPSRLLTAFPPEALIRRRGLAEAIAEMQRFVAAATSPG